MHACNLNIHGVEAPESKLQDYSHLCVEFYVSMGAQETMAKNKQGEESVKQIAYIPGMKKKETQFGHGTEIPPKSINSTPIGT